ncbi:MAG: bacillithiol biosynthesis deacetylase BshB1 [Spirosomataceae bacterium]
MKLDILALAAHPDDAEMSVGGTLALQIAKGRKVGIVDFTRGELGTRGTPEIRAKEAADAAQILGIHVLENLGFRDGFFKNDEEHQLKVVQAIRRYQPEIVLANAIDDRHLDHPKAAQLANDACFLSGLRMIKTYEADGTEQPAWRPKWVYHYIQDRYVKPDFIVDITPYWNLKEQAIRAYRSQFYDPTSTEPASYLSSPEFLDFLRARAQEFGHQIGAIYGEGFTSYRQLGVNDLFALR